MGEQIKHYLSIANVYLILIYKRGYFSILSIILANLITLLIKGRSALLIVEIFCYFGILTIVFVDIRNVELFFKLFLVSKFSLLKTKVVILLLLGAFQYWVFQIIIKT
jgi:hypothetical protein